MTGTELAVFLAIGELILKYGLSMAMEMLKALQTDNPTVDDIRALALRVPHPDTYEGG